MKKREKNSKLITAVALAVFGVGMVGAVFGLAMTVKNIDNSEVARTPEAVLASAGVTAETEINLPVSYFDQKADGCVNMYDAHASKALATRQFEWTECGYQNKKIEQGIVGFELGEDYLPVAIGGKLDANLGLADMTRWFAEVGGKSKAYSGTLKLNYRGGEKAEFSYVNNDFYPLDAAGFSYGDKANTDGHNHLFTMNFAVPFMVTASGDEAFEIVADDDTFVFVGNELAVDMGGIHDATSGRLAINDKGEVYTGVADEELAYSGINVTKDENLVVRIFHADRDSENSVFRVKFKGMKLNVISTQLADADGVQIAYDPSDPGYVAPLGETTTFTPDVTRGHLIAATILGVMVVVCAMFMAMLAHSMIKNRK